MYEVLEKFGFKKISNEVYTHSAKWGEVEVQARYNPKRGTNVFLRHINAKEGNGKFNCWGNTPEELEEHIIEWQTVNLPKVILKNIGDLPNISENDYPPYENDVIPQGLCILLPNQEITVVLDSIGRGDFNGDVGEISYLGCGGCRYASLGEIIKYRPSLLNVSLIG